MYVMMMSSIFSDKPMQINEGRFLQNGKCGYVLMPDCMFEPGFNPLDVSTHVKATPITIRIQVSPGSIPLPQQAMILNEV